MWGCGTITPDEEEYYVPLTRGSPEGLYLIFPLVYVVCGVYYSIDPLPRAAGVYGYRLFGTIQSHTATYVVRLGSY